MEKQATVTKGVNNQTHHQQKRTYPAVGYVLLSWRVKNRLNQERSVVEERLALENARLKRQVAEQAEELAILKKAAAYFAKSLK